MVCCKGAWPWRLLAQQLRGLGVRVWKPLPGAWTPPSPAPHLCSGWFYGERLRDGEMGWFPEDFARCITSRVAVEGNVRRMERLRVETGV